MTRVLYDTPGPRTRTRIRIWTAIAAVIVAAALWAAVSSLASIGELDPEVWAVLARLDLQRTLFNGLVNTITATLVTLGLSLLFGLVLVILRMMHVRWVQVVVAGCINVLRSLPALIIIIFIFLGAPVLGVELSLFWSLVIGLTIYEGPMIAEIVRSGIVALSHGQTEAGSAIGLSRFQVLYLILLPQAVRNMLPAIVTEAILILKETSLGFVIGFPEFLHNGGIAISYLGGRYALPVYVESAVVYIALCLLLAWFATWLSRRLR